ncbi:integrator complex subunit 10-like isoform X2 [Antedon mediterranea]|uniref:integrator complex subunit 10-like isoform X2 n=1 Tax=Antedon mediterranea TaxID=105859 RepID=UPI003AF47BA1
MDVSQSLSGPEWMVEKAQKCLRTDLFASKSLLITARSLYPRNFRIQFEAYRIEKSARKTAEGAAILLDMFQHFFDEPVLQDELQALIVALQSESQDPSIVILRDMFDSFPSKAKYDILQKTSVCEVLPLVIANKQIEVPIKFYAKWLQKSMAYYLSYITQPPRKHEQLATTPVLTSPTHNASSPMKSPCYSRPGFDGPPKEGASDSWEKMHELIIKIAEKCGWNLHVIPKMTGSVSSRFQHLSECHRQQPSDAPAVSKSIFYSTVLLFLKTAFTYASTVDSEAFASTNIGHSTSLLLLEDLNAKLKSKKHKHKHKKLRLDENDIPLDSDSSDDPGLSSIPANLKVNKSYGITPELIENFETGIDCWKLLYANEYFEKDLNWLLHRWKADTWQWLTSFQTDMMIFKGDFSQALRMLQEKHKQMSSMPLAEVAKDKLKILLQMAACHFRLAQFSSACEMTLDAVSLMPSSETSVSKAVQPEKPSHTSKYTRMLLLLPVTGRELLPYCINLLLQCYKKKSFHHHSTKDDKALGHMIVLMQYNWPKEESLFSDAIKKIRKQGTFTYSLFFKFIINIDILEEFAFLATEEAGQIEIDLLPPAQRQKVVTRGVVKGGKEDFRIALENQVKRCEENVEFLLKQFLVCERDTLLEHLM